MKCWMVVKRSIGRMRKEIKRVGIDSGLQVFRELQGLVLQAATNPNLSSGKERRRWVVDQMKGKLEVAGATLSSMALRSALELVVETLVRAGAAEAGLLGTADAEDTAAADGAVEETQEAPTAGG